MTLDDLKVLVKQHDPSLGVSVVQSHGYPHIHLNRWYPKGTIIGERVLAKGGARRTHLCALDAVPQLTPERVAAVIASLPTPAPLPPQVQLSLVPSPLVLPALAALVAARGCIVRPTNVGDQDEQTIACPTYRQALQVIADLAAAAPAMPFGSVVVSLEGEDSPTAPRSRKGRPRTNDV